MLQIDYLAEIINNSQTVFQIELKFTIRVKQKKKKQKWYFIIELVSKNIPSLFWLLDEYQISFTIENTKTRKLRF